MYCEVVGHPLAPLHGLNQIIRIRISLSLFLILSLSLVLQLHVKNNYVCWLWHVADGQNTAHIWKKILQPLEAICETG